MNVVPLVRETPAARRLRERLSGAAAAAKPANKRLVDELVAAMVEAAGAGVDGDLSTALALGAINDVMQAFAADAQAARAQLERLRATIASFVKEE
jgi:hypothetical protein